MVERTARVTARPAPPPPRIRDPRPSFSSLTEDGRARHLGEPDLLDALEDPGPLHLRERTVHARYERVPLLEDHPEVLLHADGRELADDLPVRDLHGRHVEGGGEVDYEAVDLAVLERGNGRIVRVVDGRRAAGPDVPNDVLVARRA